MRAVVPRRWDIFASVVLRRDPIIAVPMTDLETRYQRSQIQKEDERSLLCDFELKTKKDEKLLARRQQLEAEGKELSELDGELGVTSAMNLDEWTKKADSVRERFELRSPKRLEVDSEQSLWRELDRKLVLVVKQRLLKGGKATPWILPQTKHNEGESLRATAERCVASMLKGSSSVSIAGNAPIAVFSHSYPKPLKDQLGSDGAKIFFFDAHIASNSGDTNVNKDEVEDYKWVNHEEFWKTVPGKAYKSSVRSAFLE